MKHSKVNNYVIAGLSSSLVGGEGNGCVRLFEQEIPTVFYLPSQP